MLSVIFLTSLLLLPHENLTVVPGFDYSFKLIKAEFTQKCMMTNLNIQSFSEKLES